MYKRRGPPELDSIMNSSFNIGVDFGGVLSKLDKEEFDKNSEHFNTAIDIPDAIDNILKLKSLGHKLFLISYCGRPRALETKESLDKTVISENMMCSDLFEEMYFVKEKAFKKDLCEFLNCQFMIDDRIGIQLNILTSSCKTIPILFGNHSESVKSAMNWNEVTKIILETPFFDNKKKSYVRVKKPVELIHKL